MVSSDDARNVLHTAYGREGGRKIIDREQFKKKEQNQKCQNT